MHESSSQSLYLHRTPIQRQEIHIRNQVIYQRQYKAEMTYLSFP